MQTHIVKKRDCMNNRIIILLIAFLLVISCADTQKNNVSLITNHKFIESLYDNTNYANTSELFELVFSQLDNEVAVYPSENYYYFELPLNGKILAGNIGLSAHQIDEGKIYFAHYEKSDKFSPIDTILKFGGRYFDKNDGVNVTKADEFKYSITYKEKTVVFNLNKININPPKKAKLMLDEIFIGPNFDESGIKFFLIYNNQTNRFYWILNEEGFVPETLLNFGNGILIGERTQFAFYNDSANNRKLLIGVYGVNALNNNWYDGPFDQLPDNYIKKGDIEIKNYLEKVYPALKDKIDKYGHFLDNIENRVAINPYLIYFYAEELLNQISYCQSSMTDSEFYTCITPSEKNINPYYYNDFLNSEERYD